ncbi:MAG: hypothetical protein DI603_18205 [Roseateles depolymerans]|uniref:Uncharacterized protein n=1 Tax=Roseateles depolymerans TaxID=76731 RepID=A0A2W5DIH8_9BURK|nr:MAG: hypothetical protein DI603_18205 [Roseateles depolymerans]
MKPRAKPQRLAGLAQPGSLGIDFSDVRIGLERLDECRDYPEERELVGARLMQVLALPRTLAGVADLHDAIARTVDYGDPIGADALAALQRVTEAHAGYSMVAAVDKAQRQQSGADGERGGRPNSIWAADWSRTIERMMAENRKLTKTAAFQKLAEVWREEVKVGGEIVVRGRHWTTIRDAVHNHRKETKG